MNTEKIKKVTERIEKDEGRMNLSLYMAEVIEESVSYTHLTLPTTSRV